MKIGILTVHNQINYGGVLQAYALQQFLQQSGYDVEVIDYWITPTNNHLHGFWLHRKIPLIKKLVRLPLWLVRDGFVVSDIKRRIRTIQFLKEYICTSKEIYRGVEGLRHIDKYDMVIVGSDQIWNPSVSRASNPFLLNWLERTEGKPRKISYAASFGCASIPEDRKDEYRQSFSDFDAISVREQEGADLLASTFGIASTRVLDPSLLLSAEDWLKMAKGVTTGERRETPYIFCYWRGDMDKIVPLLKQLAQTGENIRVLCDWKTGWENFADNLKLRHLFAINKRIKPCLSAGPIEFVRLLSGAKAVLSDSFHAMAFASIFDKPMCIVHKSNKNREAMGARLWDFQEKFGSNPVVREHVPQQVKDGELFLRLGEGSAEKLKRAVEESGNWIKEALSVKS